jgi:hypothetical protein
MGLLSDLMIPALLLGLAGLLARRELRAHAERQRGDTDLFRYTTGRLRRRLAGVALLALTAFTLLGWELLPPASPRGASLYLVLMISEVLAMITLAVFDLLETARNAESADLRRQRGELDPNGE